MHLDHPARRVAADEIAPEQDVEHRLAEHEREIGAEPGARALRRSEIRRRPRARRQEPEDGRGEHDAHDRERDIGPAPAEQRHHDGDERQDQELAGCRSRGRDADAEALVAVELLLDGGRDHVGRDQPEADPREAAERDDEDPGAVGQGEQEAAGGQDQQADREHVARSLPVDEPSAERRQQRHHDERDRDGARREAARPGELGFPNRHHQPDRGARRANHGEREETERDDEQGLQGAGARGDGHGCGTVLGMGAPAGIAGGARAAASLDEPARPAIAIRRFPTAGMPRRRMAAPRRPWGFPGTAGRRPFVIASWSGSCDCPLSRHADRAACRPCSRSLPPRRGGGRARALRPPGPADPCGSRRCCCRCR